MPGAITIGLRAYRPIMILLNAPTRTVAVSTDEKGMPVSLRIAGLTAMIYMVARNVVIPAMISVRALVASESNSK